LANAAASSRHRPTRVSPHSTSVSRPEFQPGRLARAFPQPSQKASNEGSFVPPSRTDPPSHTTLVLNLASSQLKFLCHQRRTINIHTLPLRSTCEMVCSGAHTPYTDKRHCRQSERRTR
jgi:hypothetical protein